MRTKTAYICEFCGSEFENAHDCRECEVTHKEPIFWASSVLRPLQKYRKGAAVPHQVTLAFENGDGSCSAATYNFVALVPEQDEALRELNKYTGGFKEWITMSG